MIRVQLSSSAAAMILLVAESFWESCISHTQSTVGQSILILLSQKQTKPTQGRRRSRRSSSRGEKSSKSKTKRQFERVSQDHVVPGYVQKKARVMKWLSKFFKGSNHKISEGMYPEHYGSQWDYTSGSLGEHANSDGEDLDHAIALSLSEEEIKRATEIGTSAQVDDDEDLARALQASLDMFSPPRPEPTPYYPPTDGYPSGFKICAGCNTEIGYGRFLSCMGAFWHPQCFVCRSCGEAISEHEFSMSENDPYHKSCYKELHHPKCDVCKHFIPTNRAGLIEYRAHPFWGQRYCPSHEHDNTPRCCSCERMEKRTEQYILLDDGRKLCLECLASAIMDTNECQPLYLDIRDFYEGLNMKITQQIPMLLVERQALNEAFQGEKDGTNHMPETRGLCLSEEQTVTSIARRPRIGGNRILDMFTESQKLTRRCEVTAILILYGLPRLLTGSILAHELMHAWLRLNGYRTLRPEIEEGICQVLSHMWLESEVTAGSGFSDGASTSSASSSSSKSKKGVRSKSEKELGKFFMHQIAMDSSPAYGDGFRAGQAAVLQFGLRRTLDHIRYTGTFP